MYRHLSLKTSWLNWSNACARIWPNQAIYISINENWLKFNILQFNFVDLCVKMRQLLALSLIQFTEFRIKYVNLASN